MLGLQSLQMFLAIDLPKLDDLHHDPPAFPNCTNWAAPHPMHRDYCGIGGEYYIKWTAYKEMNESISFLNEVVHHKVCIQYQTKYNNLLEQIRTIKGDIEYKIKYVMPQLLPNEKALIYSKETTRKPVGFMQSCFLCWYPCGYLNNTWCPYWTPHGIHVETLLCPVETT